MTSGSGSGNEAELEKETPVCCSRAAGRCSCIEGLVRTRCALPFLPVAILLPDIHPALYAAILEGVRREPDPEIPVWVLETPTVSCNVGAVEKALKGVPVELLEFRAGDPRMNGRGLAVLQGDLYDLEAARDMALEALEAKGIAAQHRLLSAPHSALIAQIATSTRFDQCAATPLEGETAS